MLGLTPREQGKLPVMSRGLFTRCWSAVASSGKAAAATALALVIHPTGANEPPVFVRVIPLNYALA